MSESRLLGSLVVTILVAVIVFICFFIFFRLKTFAALTIGISIGYITLNILYPINQLLYQRDSFLIVLYLLIIVIVPIYLFLLLFFILLTLKR